MSSQLPVLAAESPVHFPPTTNDFNFPAYFEFSIAGIDFAITKLTVLTWLTVIIVSAVMLAAVRNPKMVPSRMQWYGESVYGFVRNGIARDVIGHHGIRFAPYLASLFMFILLNNLWGIIPLAQISPNSHMALPAGLAILTFLLYHFVGMRKQGVVKYWKDIMFMPGVPWPLYVILTPIELATHLLIRPMTLAIRLFANMFAGHLMLLVFILGGVALLNADSFALKGAAFLSFGFGIVMTFFEMFIMALQAYVFTVLTASYLQGALADEH